jgi:hypothetical protein
MAGAVPNKFIKQVFVCQVDYHSCDGDANGLASAQQKRKRRPNARFPERKETFCGCGTNAEHQSRPFLRGAQS